MENSTAAATNLATAKTALSTLASVAGAIIIARSIAHEYLPHELQDYVFVSMRKFFSHFSSKMTMVIEEFDGFEGNELYEAAEVYLGSKAVPSMQRVKVTKPQKEKELSLRMDGNEEIEDTFQGIKFEWIHVCTQVQTQNFHNPRDMNATLKQQVRSFEVNFPKKHKNIVLQSYFPYIIQEAKSMAQEKKTVKIFTTNPDMIYGNFPDMWQPLMLDHPSTFDTLALDHEVKDTILKDLDRFVRRKEYYRKVGKAWKRGYLLYGPPGTGKSSLIAAMANYLNFDVYDLELTALESNSDLRRLLVATANRSILVVEDIDCSIKFQDRNAEATVVGQSSSKEKQITLSGLLNFIDGLWSSCGDERLIVFTTNHKERLDPALLRPGRMDVHIHMSYCTPSGFKVLASNYLGIKDHKLFGEIEELIGTSQVTPAEIAEQLMKGDDPESVLVNTIEFLKKSKEDQEANKLIQLSNDGQQEPIEEK